MLIQKYYSLKWSRADCYMIRFYEFITAQSVDNFIVIDLIVHMKHLKISSGC